ncbi:hypothetical protein Brsp07_04663 [Brucella sp. NBRC 14130]|uniref:hypothetical protein n=1 Tax=Brucella sp. NBRC 14130 TaxID=3075483 RepID=UPI0030A21CEF
MTNYDLEVLQDYGDLGALYKVRVGEKEYQISAHSAGDIPALLQIAMSPEAPEYPEPMTVTVIPAVTLWERLTEAEAEQVDAAMATQPFRTRQIFLTANTFRSDHEFWPLLVQMATELFGEERAAELLMA